MVRISSRSVLVMDSGPSMSQIDFLPLLSTVDLYPPPDNFVPPICVFELDGITKEWTWGHKFSLIHIRWMFGSFSTEGWTKLYPQAYDHLEPRGWIEHIEPEAFNYSDDGSMSLNSVLAPSGHRFVRMGRKSGCPFDIYAHHVGKYRGSWIYERAREIV